MVAMGHTRTTLWLIVLLVVAAAAATVSSSSPASHGLEQRQGGGNNNGTVTSATIGCWAHERDALLEFKQGITSDPPGLLASWRPGDLQDCCRWRGIRCSSRTGHVTEIHLRNVDAEHFIDFDRRNALVGEISPSLLSLHHLKHLDLSLNNLEGPTTRFPEFLGSLKNLRYLNLSGIPFNGEVPSQLGNLTKLHYLDLSNRYSVGNGIVGIYSTDLSWLRYLPSLQYLNMASLNLSMVLDWSVVNMIPSLKVIDLSDCSLPCANQSVPHINLTQVERLDVSYNYFEHSVATCWFWNLTSLRYLGLSGTRLYGHFHHALGGMTSLQVLHFAGSEGSDDPYITDGGLSLDIMTINMKNLCNIEILDFSYSSFGGNITELLNRLPQCPRNKLRKLHMDNNDFTGVIPNLIGRWDSLLILDLSNNRITGSLPSEISMLNSLLTLDLSNNLITGSVPSEISMLNNLTELNIGGNNLTGAITHEVLTGLTSLTAIDLSGNSLKIDLDPDWSLPFSFQYAYFASCEMGPRFPSWLQSQVQIVELDISCAAISDNLPAWFPTAFSNASKVNISHNGISGTLPANMEDMKSLGKLYLNSNNLTGQIPRLPDSLFELDISRNSLSGPLPSNFGAPGMQDLRLFSNRITGHIPQSMCQMQFVTGVLDLADNLLEGELPECFHPELWMLILSNNRFSGAFPPSLKKCTDLYVLDLDSNNFSGRLPMWIGDMNLEIVRLGHNNFSGSIPETITNITKLLHLDLSGNRISGILPRNLSNLMGMTARGNPTSFSEERQSILNLSVSTKGGARYYEDDIIFKMVIIDLSSNILTGEIPEEITALDRVISLNFSRNILSGKIPSKIGVMQALESLDLSENKLYGGLPQSLSNLTYLSFLDLSYNNLTGSIPSGGQLDTLYSQHPFMYDGNSGLCGHPLQKNCSKHIYPKHGDHINRRQQDSKLTPFSLGLGVGFVVGLWVVFCVTLFKKSWRVAYFRLYDTVSDKVYVFAVVNLARWAKRTDTH